jgi:acetolactate synthase-1/2/3 large subunit
MQSRRTALQALKGTRCFSTSQIRPAASPYRRTAPAAAPKVVKEDAKRPQSTAAAPKTDIRARPSPAFNRQDYDVQPLRQRQPEMDHSFVGMKGGEIFHEMMLRQGVKHVCT